MHPESLTQKWLLCSYLVIQVCHRKLTAPSCTDYLPFSCSFYYSDLNNLNSSKWVMILWEKRGYGLIWNGLLYAGTPSWLDPGVGEPSALLLGIFLRYVQLNAISALLQYVQQQNTHTEIAVQELLQVPELSRKALQAGEAACEGMGSKDQT